MRSMIRADTIWIGLTIGSAIVGGLFFSMMGAMPAYAGYSGVISSWMVVGIAALSRVPAIARWRWRALVMMCGLGMMAYAFEYIGMQTCVPYGCFAYGEMMGYKLWDIVPRGVFFAWSPLVLGVWAIARHRGWRWWQALLVGPVLLVCVDLVLDPGAVAAGMRTYTPPGIYFGVPLTNFAGRLLTGAIGIARSWRMMRDSEYDRTQTGRYLLSMIFVVVFWMTYWMSYMIHLVLL